MLAEIDTFTVPPYAPVPEPGLSAFLTAQFGTSDQFKFIALQDLLVLRRLGIITKDTAKIDIFFVFECLVQAATYQTTDIQEVECRLIADGMLPPCTSYIRYVLLCRCIEGVYATLCQ